MTLKDFIHFLNSLQWMHNMKLYIGLTFMTLSNSPMTLDEFEIFYEIEKFGEYIDYFELLEKVKEKKEEVRYWEQEVFVSAELSSEEQITIFKSLVPEKICVTQIDGKEVEPVCLRDFNNDSHYIPCHSISLFAVVKV